MHKRKLQPGDIIGYVNGKPVPAIGGGSIQPGEAPVNTPTSTNISSTADGGLLVGTDPRPTFSPLVPAANSNSSNQQLTQSFTADDIAKARQQEKEKLYPEMQTMKEQLAELKKERDTKLEAEKKSREAAEKALKDQQTADTDTRTLLEQQRLEFEAKLVTLSQERDAERAVQQMERQFQELQTYKANALAATVDSIIPQLAEEVRVGQHATTAEIDSHIARLQATSESIMQEVQAAQVAARAGMRGVPVTAPAGGPLENYTANDPVFEAANNGTLTMNDYIKNRDKLLPAASQMRQQGIYG